VSALAEALVAAQRATLTAMAKAHVSYLDGEPNKDAFHALLNSIGCTDQVEQEQLWAAWDTLRSAGAAPPTGQPPLNGEPKKPEPASDAQLALIARLVKEKKAQPPDLPLNKVEAHEVIDTLKAGTYDYAKWHVAF
jgi:hypothetical protein